MVALFNRIWNHKRVYRIYRELELNLRIKLRRRLVRERPEPLGTVTQINQTWSIDFMHDKLSNGRDICLLNVVDDFILPIQVSRSKILM